MRDTLSITEDLEGIKRCIEDLLQRVKESDIGDFWSWPQVWGDTSCGFGGIAGQAITSAQTLVFEVMGKDYNPSFYVYHAYRYAYHVTNPSLEFKEDMQANSLAGAGEFSKRWHYEYR